MKILCGCEYCKSHGNPMEQPMTPCYQCLTPAPLSPRARCVTCEYRRSIANEQENEILYAEIDALKQEIQKLQKDLS